MTNKFETNIFNLLKGGIKGYQQRVSNISREQFPQFKDSCLLRNDFIPEIHKHLKVCEILLQANVNNPKFLVKMYEYAFLTDDAKNLIFDTDARNTYEQKVSGFLECWGNYIDILKNKEDITIEDIPEIYNSLSNVNYKVVSYQFYTTNNNNKIKLDENKFKAQKTKIKKNILEKFIEENCKLVWNENALCAESKDGVVPYTYNRDSFIDFNPLRKITTVLSIEMGRIYASFIRDKNRKETKGKIADISTNSVDSFINSIIHNRKSDSQDDFLKYRKTIFNEVNSLNNVMLSDIINYYKDSTNHEKIFYDFYIGSLTKNKVDFNKIYQDIGVGVVCDQNELKIVHAIDHENRLKSFNFTKIIESERILKNYMLYGYKMLNAVDPNVKDLDSISLFLYFMLRGHIVSEHPILVHESETLPVNLNKCIRDLLFYFNKKDNSFDRKKNFMVKFDNTIEYLVAYRNRVCKYPMDVDLIEKDYSKINLNKVLLEKFFIKKGTNNV